MYMPPHMGSQLASERRREMLAQAQQQHQARKVAALARASRRAERAERRMRRAVRKALRLRAGLGQWRRYHRTGHARTTCAARQDQPAADTRRVRRPAPRSWWRGALPRETRQREDATTGQPERNHATQWP